jgi:hypothetical protein
VLCNAVIVNRFKAIHSMISNPIRTSDSISFLSVTNYSLNSRNYVWCFQDTVRVLIDLDFEISGLSQRLIAFIAMEQCASDTGSLTGVIMPIPYLNHMFYFALCMRRTLLSLFERSARRLSRHDEHMPWASPCSILVC